MCVFFVESVSIVDAFHPTTANYRMATKHFLVVRMMAMVTKVLALHKENSKTFTLFVILVAEKKIRSKNSERHREIETFLRTVSICCKCVQEYYITTETQCNISNKYS